MESRSSDSSHSTIVLPRWQPDHEVGTCPVCGSGFGFLTRRHHCRKCGRVVCNACSLHRITIPHQYIVRPPVPAGERVERPPSSAGGETVRVCNPCVPDPWTPATPRGEGEGVRRDSSPTERAEESRQYTPTSMNSGGLAPSSSNTTRGSAPVHVPNTTAVPTPSRTSIHSRRNNNVDSSSAPISRSRLFRPSSSLPPIPQVAAGPRRALREEDECPVCGCELPAGTQEREDHIQRCIAERFASPSSASIRPNSAATQLGSTPPVGSRARATSSYHSRGMAVYRATEKDCVDADGNQQECVICFEEFQPGDELGRMECLCKFHRMCIRQWWLRKGAGSCPTHQLQEE